jgi:hypothetical protein
MTRPDPLTPLNKTLDDLCQIFDIKSEKYGEHDYDDYKIFHLI